MGIFEGKKVGFSFTFGPLIFWDYFSLHDHGWIFAVIVGLLHGDEQLLFFIMTSAGEKVYYVNESYNKLGGQMLSQKFEKNDVAVKWTRGMS